MVQQLRNSRVVLSPNVKELNMKSKKRKKRRLAMLTQEEERAWIFAFGYYLEQNKSELEADELAWRDLQLEFPRLRKYDGCKP